MPALAYLPGMTPRQLTPEQTKKQRKIKALVRRLARYHGRTEEAITYLKRRGAPAAVLDAVRDILWPEKEPRGGMTRLVSRAANLIERRFTQFEEMFAGEFSREECDEIVKEYEWVVEWWGKLKEVVLPERYEDQGLPDDPTWDLSQLAGTEEKEKVMRGRLVRQMNLFHPDDITHDNMGDHVGLLPAGTAANGRPAPRSRNGVRVDDDDRAVVLQGEARVECGNGKNYAKNPSRALDLVARRGAAG